MGRIEFERDLMAYVAQRRSLSQPSLWRQLFVKKQGGDGIPHSEHVGKIVQIHLEQPVDVPVSDNAVVESEYESDKKGLFSRIIDWAVVGQDKRDSVVEPQSSVLVESELKNDLKEVAQISIRVFRQLPANKIRELKESDDFLRLKHILRKHGLSKE